MKQALYLYAIKSKQTGDNRTVMYTRFDSISQNKFEQDRVPFGEMFLLFIKVNHPYRSEHHVKWHGNIEIKRIVVQYIHNEEHHNKDGIIPETNKILISSKLLIKS